MNTLYFYINPLLSGLYFRPNFRRVNGNVYVPYTYKAKTILLLVKIIVAMTYYQPIFLFLVHIVKCVTNIETNLLNVLENDKVASPYLI